ncbi:MAG: hypothetical protein KGH79_02110 [Patescibacteria group bacterium]|nr:hypothetical protein [Patescibacteria group bacterium]
MGKQIELDGRVSGLGKLGSRYWFYFRQNGKKYGVFFESFKPTFKPVNYNYETRLRREAAALARSEKPSRRFTLSAYVESVEQDGDLIRVKFLLPGPLNQTVTTRLYPSSEYEADMGIAVGAVMERLDWRPAMKNALAGVY